RASSQLLDLELADLVRERLSWPGDVAIDLIDDVVLGLRRVGLEELDRTIARPALRVHASVDHEPHCAPHLVGELAELRVRILIHAEIVAERFGVKTPALDERGEVELMTAEARHVRQFLRERDLQVM